MTTRTALAILGIVVAGLGGVAFYAHGIAAPACDSDGAQEAVYHALHEQFQLAGIYLHDFTPLSGGYFSASRACMAEVAEIRGNVDAADLKWRQVRYRVTHSDTSESPAVSVELGDATAFVPTSEQTFWTRLRAWF